MSTSQKFLTDLARFLPAATSAQILRHYFNGNVAALRNALRAAKAKGLIEVTVELTRPWHHNGLPIASFRAGEPVPAAGAIAYQASQRWGTAIVPTVIVRASARLVASEGGEIRHIAAGHLSHALAVSEVFMNQRQAVTDFTWKLVNARPGTGVLPDAIAGGVAFEVIGRYGSGTVAAKLTLTGSMDLQLW